MAKTTRTRKDRLGTEGYDMKHGSNISGKNPDGVKKPAEETTLKDEDKKQEAPPDEYLADDLLKQKRQDLLGQEKKEPKPTSKGFFDKEVAPGPQKKPPPGKRRGRPPKKVGYKDQINEESVKGWSMMTANLSLILGGMLHWIWPKQPLSPKESEAHTRAWAVYLTLCPPDNIEAFAKMNILVVYIGIFTPRVGMSIHAHIQKKKMALTEQSVIKEEPDEGKAPVGNSPGPAKGLSNPS